MLSVGIFPDRLKYAVVKPILKNGDKSDVSNYRPISLLPASSKVFEKVIYARLYQHLANNNILIDEPFGFRSKSSNTAAAYNLINEVFDALNSKKLVGGIFCDLKKAFDSVDCDTLISKLEFYGIRGKFNALIKLYLNNRYQRVLTRNKKSCHSSLSRWRRFDVVSPRDPYLDHYSFLYI